MATGCSQGAAGDLLLVKRDAVAPCSSVIVMCSIVKNRDDRDRQEVVRLGILRSLSGVYALSAITLIIFLARNKKSKIGYLMIVISLALALNLC